jgi:hypothetical protein
MKILNASIIIGALLLIGGLPAAGQSTLAPGSGAPVRLAGGGDATADRQTYAQQARADIQEWQRKLQDFGEKAEAKGKEAGQAAATDLNKAWTRAEAASGRLQTAGAEDWESAKASFEKASRELADAWDRVRAQGK